MGGRVPGCLLVHLSTEDSEIHRQWKTVFDCDGRHQNEIIVIIEVLVLLNLDHDSLCLVLSMVDFSQRIQIFEPDAQGILGPDPIHLSDSDG